MEELKVQVLEVGNEHVVVKVGRQRKARRLIAFKDDKGHIIAQGGGMIFMIDPESRKAIYNLKGSFFVHLHPAMGAKVAKVPKDFIEALEKAMFNEGDLIGVTPDGSPVYFGGCKTF